MTILEQKKAILDYLTDNFKPGSWVELDREEPIFGLDDDTLSEYIRGFTKIGLVRYHKDKFGREITGTSDCIMFALTTEAFEFRENGGFELPNTDSKRQNVVNNNYTFLGHNSRVNNDNAIDNSINTVSHGNFSFLDDMISAIRETGDENKELLERATKLQESAGTGMFKGAYADFISLAANHVALLTPFWPQISQLALSIGS